MMTLQERPLVSIIVPVFNVERYIDYCLYSIRQQTYKNIEIIIVEDCSTDESLGRLQAHLVDSRIKLIQHPENCGLSAARNTGIDAASGDYIMFVDSDDAVDLRLVEVCVNAASTANADLVTFGYETFKDDKLITEIPAFNDGSVQQIRTLGDEYFQLQHFAWLKFIRADLMRSTDIRFPVGVYYEDWVFHWHLGLVAQHKILLMVTLYHYRQRAASITGSTDRKLLDLFTAQSQVINIVGAKTSRELQTALEHKIRDSHWSVLTRIDSELLRDALNKAQTVDSVMYGIDHATVISKWRHHLIKSIVRLSPILSMTALRILRFTLRSTSTARRRVLAQKISL